MRVFCRVSLLLLTAGVLAASASAQIEAIGTFTGDRSDGIETQREHNGRHHCLIGGVFGGTATMCNLGGLDVENMLRSSLWFFRCGIEPHSGSHFTGSEDNAVELIFDTPARRFGGYFATNSGIDDGTAEFFDPSGESMGTLPITMFADCAWTWNGWETKGAGIKRVLITSNFGKGGFVAMDDLEYSTGGSCDSCDANCDGSIDLTDVEPFIELMLGGDPCDFCAGDTNDDGSVDLTDVEGFLKCLLG